MDDFQFVAKDKPNAQDLNREAVRERRYSNDVARKVSEAINGLPSDAVEVSVQVRADDPRVSFTGEDGSRRDGKSYTQERTDLSSAKGSSVSVTSKSGLVPTSAVVDTPEGLYREDTHGDLTMGYDKRTNRDAQGRPDGSRFRGEVGAQRNNQSLGGSELAGNSSLSNDKPSRTPERVTSDGVRHTAKDDREHGFGGATPFGGTERRGSGADNGLRRRSTD